MSDITDLYDDLVLSVKQRVGGNQGLAVLGSNITRALVALEILNWQRRMDGFDAANDRTLLDTTRQLYAELNDQFPWVDT